MPFFDRVRLKVGHVVAALVGGIELTLKAVRIVVTEPAGADLLDAVGPAKRRLAVGVIALCVIPPADRAGIVGLEISVAIQRIEESDEVVDGALDSLAWHGFAVRRKVGVKHMNAPWLILSNRICTMYKHYQNFAQCQHAFVQGTKMKPVQLKMARAALGLGVRDLADMTGITANTISRIENGSDAKLSTLDSLRTALESAGVIFIDANGYGPGVRLRDK